MEKLELKHLDFQNNGFVRLTRLPHWDFERVELKNCSLNFNDKEPYLRYKDVTFRLDQIKCYKRPLSDLTKEIEVNGEKFVPIDIIYKLWYGNYLGQFSKDIILQKIKLFSIKMPYIIVEKLHEWHFDTNQLIEKGLAIDFNTL